MIKPDEIMTPAEVAALLRIHIRTVYNLAERGNLPGTRIGRSWRFNRRDLQELLSKWREKTSPMRPSPGLKPRTSTR